MSAGISYLRGAFIAYEPGGYPAAGRTIPFRFNPEGLSRSLTVEHGGSSQGTEGALTSSGSISGDRAAGSTSGPVKESFTIQVRLDFADRLDAALNLSVELGIAPEIAAIEALLYPAPSEADAASAGCEPVRPRQQRPTVLFVWGPKRVLPVHITALTINESVYNALLYPVRAELDVAVEVMSKADALDSEAVGSALAFMQGERRKLARKFYENTADLASIILPI